MRRVPRRGLIDGSDRGMTSLIDVVFLLLIFFMCASRFQQPEGTLRSFLPRNMGLRGEIDGFDRSCRITLRRESTGETQVMVDERRLTNRDWNDYAREIGKPGFDATELEEHLLRRRDNYTGFGARGLPVTIDFGESVPYHDVVKVLNSCRHVHITDIRIAMPADAAGP